MVSETPAKRASSVCVNGIVLSQATRVLTSLSVNSGLWPFLSGSESLSEAPELSVKDVVFELFFLGHTKLADDESMSPAFSNWSRHIFPRLTAFRSPWLVRVAGGNGRRRMHRT